VYLDPLPSSHGLSLPLRDPKLVRSRTPNLSQKWLSRTVEIRKRHSFNKFATGSRQSTQITGIACRLQVGSIKVTPKEETRCALNNEIIAVGDAGETLKDRGRESLAYDENVHLNGPRGMIMAPNGHLIVANNGSVNSDPSQRSELVEFTRGAVRQRHLGRSGTGRIVWPRGNDRSKLGKVSRGSRLAKYPPNLDFPTSVVEFFPPADRWPHIIPLEVDVLNLVRTVTLEFPLKVGVFMMEANVRQS